MIEKQKQEKDVYAYIENLKKQIAELETALKNCSNDEKVTAQWKESLETALAKLRATEEALANSRTNSKIAEEIEILRRQFREVETNNVECRKNLDGFLTEERNKKIKEAEAKTIENNGGFVKYYIIPKADAPIAGRNTILVGNTGP